MGKHGGRDAPDHDEGADGVATADGALLPTWEYVVLTATWTRSRTGRGRWRYAVGDGWAEAYEVARAAAVQAQSTGPLLDALGADGWELVTVVATSPAGSDPGGPAGAPGQTFHLKRIGFPRSPRPMEDNWWWGRW